MNHAATNQRATLDLPHEGCEHGSTWRVAVRSLLVADALPDRPSPGLPFRALRLGVQSPGLQDSTLGRRQRNPICRFAGVAAMLHHICSPPLPLVQRGGACSCPPQSGFTTLSLDVIREYSPMRLCTRAHSTRQAGIEVAQSGRAGGRSCPLSANHVEPVVSPDVLRFSRCSQPLQLRR